MLRHVIADTIVVEKLDILLDTVCNRRGVTDTAGREQCAEELAAFYASGVTEADELLLCMNVSP